MQKTIFPFEETSIFKLPEYQFKGLKPNEYVRLTLDH